MKLGTNIVPLNTIPTRSELSSESSLMMEAVRTSETSVDNHFIRQYIPEDNSEHHTRRRENLKSHTIPTVFILKFLKSIMQKWLFILYSLFNEDFQELRLYSI
jgi:hypothetical protein